MHALIVLFGYALIPLLGSYERLLHGVNQPLIMLNPCCESAPNHVRISLLIFRPNYQL